MSEPMEMILQLGAFALTALCLIYVLPYLKERLGAEKLKSLWKAVCIAVQAAEQLFGAGAGARKKEYVLDALSAQHLSADEGALDTLIEAAVRELT